MARNLMAAGHPVLGYRRGDMAAFVDAGGCRAGSVAEIAATCDVVLGCLPGADAFREVHLAADGLAAHVRTGAVVADFGTQTPDLKAEARDRYAARGAILLDAEISGTPMMAEARQAVLYLAGDPEGHARLAPCLDAMADLSLFLGAFGNAHRMKLLANHLVAVHTLATAEVMLLGLRGGLDPDAIIQAIGQSGGASTIFSVRAPWMAARRFEPAAGPIGDLTRYFDMIQAIASGQGTGTPLLDVAADLFRRAAQAGRGHQDVAAIIAVLEDEARTAA